VALHEPILELLYEHLSKYLPEADSNGSPILFDKCVQLNGASAVLTVRNHISHTKLQSIVFCIRLSSGLDGVVRFIKFGNAFFLHIAKIFQ
jgi:hypothetical protein